MKYELVFLDLDRTLVDFDGAQAISLGKTLEEFGFEYNDDILAVYNEINDYYWEAFEEGKVTKPQLETNRFRDFLNKYNWSADPTQMHNRYMSILPENKILYPQAEEVCRQIAQRAAIVVATNGNAAGQLKVVKNSAIAAYVKAVAVSESAGYPKPDKRFFEYAMGLSGFSDKSKVLMVGDSLSADIAGAIGFGLDSCWYNPDKAPLPKDMEPTYIIHELIELLNIIN